MDAKTRRLLAALSLAPMAAMPAGILAEHAGARPVQKSAQREAGVWRFNHEQVLGTSLEIEVRASNADEAHRAEAAALAAFDRDEAILSAWRPESEFSRWQRTRFVPIEVSPELFAVLDAFDGWRERTDGALDPSVEAATRLWKSTTAEGRTPTEAELAQTLEAMRQPHWLLDAERRRATRLSDTPLALASFTKSWITARAAEAALSAGASGAMLNVGGDVVARGDLTQTVEIADPRSGADNGASLDRVEVRDRAVATSGGAKRGFDIAAGLGLAAPEFSHLFDPRTARPVAHVLSSTVIARNAATAGALATAFAVMPPEESQRLAASIPGVDYLLLLADGRRVQSRGWNLYRSAHVAPATLEPAAWAAPVKPRVGLWNPAFELTVGLELPRAASAHYRRPYVAVWIEDEDRYPVRTLALWSENPRWLPDLKQWYRDDQLRHLSEGTDISRTVGSATRPPGKYILKWDGKDNEGKPVKAGTYTVVVEAVREHGGYQTVRNKMNFSAKPASATLPAGGEIGTVTLAYKKR